jgi:hypothetical protein
VFALYALPPEPVISFLQITTMKNIKIIYWTTTILIFLMDGLMPALTSHTDLAKEGIRHLGYPDYFRVILTVYKVIGALILILPFVKGRIKEWAYAGFGFNFITAATSHFIVDGFNGQTIFPVVAFSILAVSYTYYHRMKKIGAAETRFNAGMLT